MSRLTTLQITYVGVPLTVAGVLPLLWNMFKALWIRYQLSNSIPLDYQRFFSLIADPAAGKVTVVGRTPRLAQPGLWMASYREHEEDSRWLRFMRLRPKMCL